MPGPQKKSLTKHLKPRRSAQNHFVGRKQEIDLFWNFLQLDEQQDHAILNFFGVGGIGKSTLTQKLQLDLIEKYPETIVITLDFESLTNHYDHVDQVIFLEKFRSQLSKKIPCYHFDLLYHYWWNKSNPQVPLKHLNVEWLDDSELLTGLFSIVEDLPLIGLINKTIKAGWKSSVALRKWLATHGNGIIEELKNAKASEHEIAAMMPEQLAKDLDSFFAKSDMQIVVFIDGYEALWDNAFSRRQENFFQQDLWLRSFIGSLVEYDVNWVISGREALRWEELKYEGWNGYIHYQLIGELPEKDALSLLESRGIDDLNLANEIIRLTSGFPVLLDFFMDVFSRSLLKDKSWVLDEFESITEAELASRFLRYLDQNERDTIYALACAGTWSLVEFEAIAKEITGYPITSYYDLKGFSFIFQEGETEFSMHAKIAEYLSKSWDESNKKKVYQLLTEILREKAAPFQELSRLNNHQLGVILRLIKMEWALNPSSDWFEKVDPYLKLLEKQNKHLPLAKLTEGFSNHIIDRRLTAFLLNTAGNYYSAAAPNRESILILEAVRCFSESLENLQEEGNIDDILVVSKNKANALFRHSAFDACAYIQSKILPLRDQLSEENLTEVQVMLFDAKTKAVLYHIRWFPEKIGLFNSYLKELIPPVPLDLDRNSLIAFNKRFKKLLYIADIFKPYLLKLLKFSAEYDEWEAHMTSVYSYLIQCCAQDYYQELFPPKENKDDFFRERSEDDNIKSFLSAYIGAGLSQTEANFSISRRIVKNWALYSDFTKFEHILESSLTSLDLSKISESHPIPDEVAFAVSAAFELGKYELLRELVQFTEIEYVKFYNGESRDNLIFAYALLLDYAAAGRVSSLSRAGQLLHAYYELLHLYQFANCEKALELPEGLIQKINSQHVGSKVEQTLLQVLLHLLSRDWKKANELFQVHLDEYQDHWQYRNLYGAFLVRVGDDEQAEQHLLAAIELAKKGDDEWAISTCNLSFLYIKQKKTTTNEVLGELRSIFDLAHENRISISSRIVNYLYDGLKGKRMRYLRGHILYQDLRTRETLLPLLSYQFSNYHPEKAFNQLRYSIIETYTRRNDGHLLVSKMDDWGTGAENISKFTRKEYLEVLFCAGFYQDVRTLFDSEPMGERSEKDYVMNLIAHAFLIENKEENIQLKQLCHDHIADNRSLGALLLFVDALSGKKITSEKVEDVLDIYNSSIGVTPLESVLNSLLSIDHHWHHSSISEAYFPYLQARNLYQDGQTNLARSLVSSLETTYNENDEKFRLHLKCFEALVLSEDKPELSRSLLGQLEFNLKSHYDRYHPIQIPLLMDYISCMKRFNQIGKAGDEIQHLEEIINHPRVLSQGSMVFKQVTRFLNEIG